MKYAIIVGIAILRGAIPMSAGNVTVGSPVGVYLDFKELPSKIAVETMEKETSDVLRPMGITIAWRRTPENKVGEVFTRLAVVTFTGQCACENVLPAASGAMVLGTTAVTGGHVQPFIEVRCDAIRRVMHEVEFMANRTLGDIALGRVMSHVLAHELYHVVLGTTHHAASGLAQKFLTPEDLLSSDCMFDKNDWDLYFSLSQKAP